MKKLREIYNHKLIINFLFYVSLTYMVLSLIFSRSFVGIYIFGFRMGEIFMLLSLIMFFYFLFFIKNVNHLTKNLKLIYTSLLITFILIANLSNSSLLSAYTYKTSSYIWSLGFLMLGIYSRKINFNKFYLLMFSGILFIVYLVAIFDFPNIIQIIFLNFSDKYEPHKAADIVLLIIIFIIYLNNFFKNSLTSLVINLSVFSLFLPLLLFKSRASFIACFVFLIYILFDYRITIKSNVLKILIILIPCFVLTTISTMISQTRVIDEYSFEEVSDSYTSLGQYKFNTYVEDQSLFYIENGRIYSGDGNLNWRLRMWQDQILFTLEEGSIFSGVGYKEKLKVFRVETPPEKGGSGIPGAYGNDRKGLDGLNEHIHNYFLTIFARGGLIHLTIFIYLYLFFSFNISKGNFKLFLITLFCVLFVSSFDSSMENAHFPLIFYFFLGNNFFNINLNQY